MKAFLLHPHQDLDPGAALPGHIDDLTVDLELNTLWTAMADGDQLVFDQVKRAVLLPVTDPAVIVYRQQVLADCLGHPDLIREIYTVATQAVFDEKKTYLGMFRASPEAVLTRSIQVLQRFVVALTQLRRTADSDQAVQCRSAGMDRLFTMLTTELDDEYLRTVDEELVELRFTHGVDVSAGLGPSNKGADYVLRKPEHQNWLDRLVDGRPAGYSFQIANRDEAGAQALAELRDQGITGVAGSLAQSAEHILSFFTLLRSEAAFYVGCLNLADRLTAKGQPFCFPLPVAEDEVTLTATGLYEICLALTIATPAVTNDVSADGKALLMVTGANQGGKSTFLRSLGLAQLMMQCGLFVPAESFRANVCPGVFTHYKREEDSALERGKLDEELHRMSAIADSINPGSLLLCNESFAATNEREGSEIARQVIRACVEAGVKVVFVTHLYDLAHGLYADGPNAALFLRAERETNGRRSYKIAAGEPLPTSFGQDSFARVFGTPPVATSMMPGT